MFNKPDTNQKRVDDRLDVLWDAKATIDDKEYVCEVANISTAGVLVKLDKELEKGHHFLLDVQELNEYAVEVAWANRPFYGLILLVGDNLKLKDIADKIGLENKS